MSFNTPDPQNRKATDKQKLIDKKVSQAIYAANPRLLGRESFVEYRNEITHAVSARCLEVYATKLGQSIVYELFIFPFTSFDGQIEINNHTGDLAVLKRFTDLKPIGINHRVEYEFFPQIFHSSQILALEPHNLQGIFTSLFEALEDKSPVMEDQILVNLKHDQSSSPHYGLIALRRMDMNDRRAAQSYEHIRSSISPMTNELKMALENILSTKTRVSIQAFNQGRSFIKGLAATVVSVIFSHLTNQGCPDATGFAVRTFTAPAYHQYFEIHWAGRLVYRQKLDGWYCSPAFSQEVKSTLQVAVNRIHSPKVCNPPEKKGSFLRLV